jgi:hypothetical protein
VNRDPIEERGGVNVYAFVGNEPIEEIDYIGLKTWWECKWSCGLAMVSASTFGASLASSIATCLFPEGAISKGACLLSIAITAGSFITCGATSESCIDCLLAEPCVSKKEAEAMQKKMDGMQKQLDDLKDKVDKIKW